MYGKNLDSAAALLIEGLIERLRGNNEQAETLEELARAYSDFSSLLLGEHWLAAAKRLVIEPDRQREVLPLLERSWRQLQTSTLGLIDFHVTTAYVRLQLGDVSKARSSLGAARRMMRRHHGEVTDQQRHRLDVYDRMLNSTEPR